MIIEASGIRKRFGDLEVLKGVDFQVEEREVVSIMGASGAGKSTLLQILGTLLTPDGGGIFPPSGTGRSASSSRPITSCRSSMRWRM